MNNNILINRANHFFDGVVNSEQPLSQRLPLRGITKANNVFSLREFLKEDRAQLSAMVGRMNNFYNENLNNPNQENPYRMFWAFEPKEGVSTSELVNRFIGWASKERQEEPRNVYRLAICDKDNNVVGGITMNMLSCKNTSLHDCGDIGYFIDPERAGEHFVSSSLDLLVPEFFAKNNKNKGCYENVGLVIHDENPLSQFVAKAIGAKPTDIPVTEELFTDYRQWQLNIVDFMNARKEKIKAVRSVSSIGQSMFEKYASIKRSSEKVDFLSLAYASSLRLTK